MKQKGDLAYYLTLFKVEGHTTWRVHTGGRQTDFEQQQLGWTNAPKLTESKQYRIDRLTGEITPL